MSFYFLCFIGWTIFTLSFSEGIYKGILMIIKLIMPLFFYIYSLERLYRIPIRFGFFLRKYLHQFIFMCWWGFIALLLDYI